MADARAMGEGVLYDRGYRGYDGPRAGRASAIWALFVYSLRRAVGIGRRWTAKILPIFLYLVAFGPVLLFIGLRVILGSLLENGPDYGNIFGILTLVVLIFGATAAPEMLCDDRRQGVLPLYFSRTITRGDYLLAKLGALAVVLLSVTALPMLLMFVGNILLASDLTGYARDNADDLWRLIALSLLVSVFYAAIALAIAANVDRKGVAAAIFAGVFLVGTGLVAAVRENIAWSGRDYVLLASPGRVAEGLTSWIFPPEVQENPPPFNGAWFLISVLVVVVVCGVLLYRRYLRED
ncbi:MAG: ABC transporter permease subunit [Thermomicrobiales bacterium]